MTKNLSKPVPVSLPEDMKKEIDAIAKAEGINRSALVRKIIEADLKRRRRKRERTH